MDKLEIEILEDGTIKTSTGAVGSVNHQNAEAFMAFLAKMTGGASKRTARGAHAHLLHDHSHEQDHDHN